MKYYKKQNTYKRQQLRDELDMHRFLDMLECERAGRVSRIEECKWYDGYKDDREGTRGIEDRSSD